MPRAPKKAEWLEPENLKQIEMWAREGLSNEQICKNMGVAVTSFFYWRKSSPEFQQALKNGRRVLQLEIENALVKAAKGYDVEETEETETYDSDGEITGKVIKRKKRHIPPSVGAIVFYLKNRRPDRWKDKPIDVISTEQADDGLLDALNEKALDDWQEETNSDGETA